MYTVLVSEGCHERGLDLLRSREDIRIQIMNTSSQAALMADMTQADAVLVRTTPLPKDILEGASKLRIVSRHGVGFDNVDVAYLSTRNIPMALAVDSNVTSVAEHTLTLLLALAKDTFKADAEQRKANYSYRDARTARDVRGMKVLVMGIGRIGQHVARLFQMLGMEIYVYDPFVPTSELQLSGHPVNDYCSVLPDMDVVTLHLPLSKATKNCIGVSEIACMKPDALILNCARGGLIDEAALYAALKQGQLGGAGLDVFATEPPPADNPLFTLDNVVVSPHNAALTDACAGRMSYQAAENILACFDGKLEPRVVINRKAIGM